MTTICLNMIVKNESLIITRLFDSLIGFIDSYCICDTGSTDNTIELITNYFSEKNIPGKVIIEPFINFKHNRNIALNACIGMSDYILVLDADMKIEVKNFNKQELVLDYYTVIQGNEHFHNYNNRIIKNNGLFEYIYVTHEALVPKYTATRGSIPKDKIFILDIGDGGSKSDKFERDIRLITEAIPKEPEHITRYTFYLANSYFDSGKHVEAIEHYKNRIELDGWIQEKWYSYYRIGLSYKELNNMPKALEYWLYAYDCFPERLENILEIVTYFRNSRKYNLAKLYIDIAKKIINQNYDKSNYLFLLNIPYIYSFDYEYSIIAYYLGIKNINKEVNNVFNKCSDNSILNNVLCNLKFYETTLKQSNIINKSSNINWKIKNEYRNFNSSTPCITPYNDGYVMNTRYVNYNIDKEGKYHDCDDYIITINNYRLMDKNFNTFKEIYLYPEFDGRRYIGIEDVKIINIDNKLSFIGTIYTKDEKLTLGSGDYIIDTNSPLIPKPLSCSFNNNQCEKNWVYVNYNQTLHIIYEWYPLTICKLNNDVLDIVEKKEMPNFFKHIRGSSSGFEYDNKLWFIVHKVSYENPRHYYHCIIVFDKYLNLLKHTSLFKFENESIEYCLSLIVEDDRVIIPYSTWDKTTKIGIYDKQYIESLFI